MRSHNIGHSRNRYWQHAMLTTHRTAALSQRRTDDTRRSQVIQTDGCCHNIYDRINCPDFVKMYLPTWYAVSLCLSISQNIKNAQCQRTCTVRQICPLYDLCDLLQAAVDMRMIVCVMMVMAVMVFLIVCMMMIVIIAMIMIMHMHIFLCYTVQIRHIVIMVLMRRIQLYRKITCIQSGFFHSGYMYLCTIQLQ